MPAQLIVVATAAAEKADKTKIETKKEKRKLGTEPSAPIPAEQKEKYPRYRRPPVGVLNVLGQKPVQIGHFEDVATLLDNVHTQKKRLHGGSNTIFASVGNLADVQSRLVRGKLARLPEKLTIVVHEGELHA